MLDTCNKNQSFLFSFYRCQEGIRVWSKLTLTKLYTLNPQVVYLFQINSLIDIVDFIFERGFVFEIRIIMLSVGKVASFLYHFRFCIQKFISFRSVYPGVRCLYFPMCIIITILACMLCIISTLCNECSHIEFLK